MSNEFAGPYFPSLMDFGLFELTNYEQAMPTPFGLPECLVERLLKTRVKDDSIEVTERSAFFEDGVAVLADLIPAKNRRTSRYADAERDSAIQLSIAASLSEGIARRAERIDYLFNHIPKSHAPGLHLFRLPALSAIYALLFNDPQALVTIANNPNEDQATKDFVLQRIGDLAECAAELVKGFPAFFLPDSSTQYLAALSIRTYLQSVVETLGRAVRSADTRANSGLVKLRKIMNSVARECAGRVADLRRGTAPKDTFDCERGTGLVLPDAFPPLAEKTVAQPVSEPEQASDIDDKTRKHVREFFSKERADALLDGRLKMPALDAGRIEELIPQFPHADKMLNDVVRSFRLRAVYGKSATTLPPILLVGEPGTGKTFLATKLAEALDTYHHTYSLASVNDGMTVVGTNRGWSTANPSLVARVIAEGGFWNPAIVLDEVDKAGTTRHNGNALLGLLPLLEKHSARHWHDQCLSIEVDASHISWIATANTLEGIPQPFLSRFQVYLIRPPERSTYGLIIDSVVRELARELDVHPALLPVLDGEDRLFLIDNCRDIRTLAMTVRRLLEHRAIESAVAPRMMN